VPYPQNPQFQPPKPTKLPRAWQDIANGFRQNDQYLQSLIQKLQTYLSTIVRGFGIFNVSSPTQSPYAVQATDTFIGASASTTEAQTINLGQSTGSGTILIVKKLDSNPFGVVIVAYGTDTIDGSASYTLTTQYDAVRLIDGASGQWSIW